MEPAIGMNEIRLKHETYVSFETAKLLTEAGFDWEADTIMAFWEDLNDGRDRYFCDRLYIYQYRHPNCWGGNWKYYYRPKLETAQRWLREAKGMHITIDFTFITEQYITSIHWRTNDASKDEYHNEHTEVVTSTFNTYEEALEAGIKKSLKVISDKD